MFGKTYENGIVTNTKLYFNIEKNINLNEFLDNTENEIYSYYRPYIDINRTFSNCIALKRNTTNKKYSKYFHLKFQNDFNFNIKDNIFNIELDKFKKGLSVENGELRRYYYVDSEKEIDVILKKLDLEEADKNIKYIEFTYNPTKGILIYKNNDLEKIYKGIIHNCPEYIVNDVHFMKTNFNAVPCLYGKYSNLQKYTVYWDLNYNNFNAKSNLFKYIIKN